VSETLTAQDLGPELMLYDSRHDEVHILNDTAKIVWEGLVAGKSEEQIVGDLRVRFSIADGDEVLSDVRMLIATFRAKGLLKR
jgi:hypothetical protein